ncbi:28S ribosomal protein S29, mitochondrial-like [Patiria miniata]|uniref:Small ribosomal subunit protein mS29 n=1 Tax=Patiria miniata TaxID=46514 RepID=A0A914BB61_PATMI|nr:28S ribosomal protein S29, mitochondrial-like [Patiria miniata]
MSKLQDGTHGTGLYILQFEAIGFQTMISHISLQINKMAAPTTFMKCYGRCLQRPLSRLLHGKSVRQFSASCTTSDAASPLGAHESTSDIFRTSESSPANHGMQHVGQYYTIPKQDVKKILPVGSPTRWEQMIVPFQEAAIMVRQPAVETIDYLKRANYDHPPVRYVLYGRRGSGKTMTLCHTLHYCHSQGWLIVHVPCAISWTVKGRFDYIDSVRHEGMYDQPAFSTEWLKYFRARNEHFLKELQSTDSYVWSKRETTEKGQPLLAIVDQGISRPKNASDAIGVILKELQRQSWSGAFKMLFAVKGVNGFFADKTIVRKPGGYIIPVREMTMVQHFKKMLQGKWINGAIVTSVDQHLLRPPRNDYKPLHLLQKEGFEMMDPFVPIYVDNYTDKEFESCIAFYKEKRWLQNESAYSEDGKSQLRFLTEKNPGSLCRVCASL